MRQYALDLRSDIAEGHWTRQYGNRFSQEYKDTIKASFVKCRIALLIDGSQDALINVRSLNNYSVPPQQSNPQLYSKDLAKASPPSDSDSECYTTATSRDSDADDTEDDSSDTEDASVTHMEVPHPNVRQVGVPDAGVPNAGVGWVEVPDTSKSWAGSDSYTIDQKGPTESDNIGRRNCIGDRQMPAGLDLFYKIVLSY